MQACWCKRNVNEASDNFGDFFRVSITQCDNVCFLPVVSNQSGVSVSVIRLESIGYAKCGRA